MTLKQFFEFISEEPAMTIGYFAIVPFTALVAGFMGRGEGHISPWKYLYSLLIYAVCVPGIFAFTLDIYLFLFERRSIMETNIFTQILPILSMILTIIIIRKNVDLNAVPGFNKLSGLVLMLTVLMSMLWFLEKTRIIVFSYLPIQYLFIILIVMIILFRYGWSKIVETNKKPSESVLDS